MKKLTFGIAAACLVFSTHSFANKNYYGANIESLTFFSSVAKDHSALATSLATGIRMNDTFALEARFGLGLTEGSGSEYGVIYGYNYKYETKIKLNNYFGIYGVGFLPFNDKLSVHVKAGFAAISVKVTERATLPELGLQVSDSTTISENGFSYRFGGTFKIENDVSIIAEYGKLPAPTNADLTQINIGINIGF